MKKKSTPAKILTSVELEVMTVLWASDGGTVKDVQTAISVRRDLAYTSVATIMKILEQKGFLASEKSEKSHHYRLRVKRDEYESTALHHIAENVFEGNPTSMVMRLLTESKITSEELKSIRALLNERLKK